MRTPRPTDPLRGDRILRMPEVLARVGVGRATLWKMIKAGRFPRALPLSPGTVGWRASDIDRWIADLINPRDAARKARKARKDRP